jgi:hypothetical protein
MAGTGNVDHVKVPPLDDPVEVDIDEIQSWCCAPVTQQPRLDVLTLQRVFEERVVKEVNLADREVVGGPPPAIDLSKQLEGERSRAVNRRPRCPVFFVVALLPAEKLFA